MNLTKLREIAKLATPGPYKSDFIGGDLHRVFAGKLLTKHGTPTGLEIRTLVPQDAEYICAAANHLGALLDIVGRAKKVLYLEHLRHVENDLTWPKDLAALNKAIKKLEEIK